MKRERCASFMGVPVVPVRRQAARVSRPCRSLFLCGVAAIAILAHPAKVCAQTATAIQGSYTVASGSVTSTRSATQDTISVQSPSAVIDWTPTDNAVGGGAISFLPGGKTALFQGSTAFTILNRVLPADTSRPIEIDGHVVSQIVNPTTGAISMGGNVWFYTPGGILVGATSVFDVGSLVLTSNAIQLGSGNTLPNPANGIMFAGASNSLSSVTISPGAQINAITKGSYVAMVAPRIVQGGTVNVNGTAAYVAAEAADITIDGGLFSIAVSTGTSADGATATDAALVHTGTTTGAGAAGIAGGNQAIYLIAVPKNDAITILVSGSLGYQTAQSASAQNGVIVLSAGYDITSAASTTDTPEISFRANSTTGSAAINFNSASLASDILGQATDEIVAPTSDTLTATAAINLSATNGVILGKIAAFAGTALQLSSSSGGVSLSGLTGTPSTVTLSGTSISLGSNIEVPGTISLTASSGAITTRSLTSDSGDIDLSAPAGAIGTNYLTATTGNVVSDVLTARRRRYSRA